MGKTAFLDSFQWTQYVLNPDKLAYSAFHAFTHQLALHNRYAKVSRDERLKWHDLTKTYFEQRKSLAQVFLLIDAGHPPQAIDVECASWLAETKVGGIFQVLNQSRRFFTAKTVEGFIKNWRFTM